MVNDIKRVWERRVANLLGFQTIPTSLKSIADTLYRGGYTSVAAVKHIKEILTIPAAR